MAKDMGLLGSAEVATRLGVDRSTLSRLVKAGKLAPVVQAPGIRGPMFFDAEAVAKLAAERQAA